MANKVLEDRALLAFPMGLTLVAPH